MVSTQIPLFELSSDESEELEEKVETMLGKRQKLNETFKRLNKLMDEEEDLQQRLQEVRSKIVSVSGLLHLDAKELDLSNWGDA